MIDTSPSMETDDSHVGFQVNNKPLLKIGDTEPFIKISLFVSEEEVTIHLVSCVIDTAKFVQMFIESNEDISNCVSSVSESKITLVGLSICSNELFLLFAPKPILPSKDIFSTQESSYDIKFQACDEFATGELYDRLLYAASGIRDYFVSNVILVSLKELVQNVNPLFANANVSRLLGYKSPELEEQSVTVLSDVCDMKMWSASISVAKGIYDSFDKKMKLLVIPLEAIETLLVDLNEREKHVVKNRFFESRKTLEELGSEIRVTRERVRQIASKVKRKLIVSHRKLNLIKDILNSLKVLCDCEYCFTTDELNKYGVSEDGLMFFSEVLGDNYSFIHIPETDCIAFSDKDGKCDWLECIEEATRTIPALLLPDEQQNIVESISVSLKELGYEIPDSIIAKIAFRKYIKNGSTLLKKSLRMGDRYEIVLEKFFPDGIKPYQMKDMESFRKGYDLLFDDDKISENDHAVVSRIVDRCVLIDQGRYMLNKKMELPYKLLRQSNMSINNESNFYMLSESDQQRVKHIVSSRFKSGYRISSNIDFERFMIFFESEYGYKFTGGADNLDLYLKSVAVIFDDRAYIYDDSVVDSVYAYLEQMDSPCIYIDTFFENFSGELYSFGIFSIDILKAFIDKNYDDIFCKWDYVYLKPDITPSDLIRNVFYEQETWSFDDLFNRLPCLKQDTIRQTMNRAEYYRIDTGVYTHIDSIELPDSEGEKVILFIKERLKVKDYVIASELDLSCFESLNSHCPFSAIRDAVFNKFLSKRYSKSGQVITRIDEKLRVLDILEQYCREIETVSFEELNSFEATFDPDGRTHSTCLIAAHNVMVRVSSDLFVEESKVSFDVNRIDEVIDLYCNGDFMPLKNVVDFSLFPYAGYPWNLFLLESYVRKFSRMFKYDVRAVNSINIGAIVRKSFTYGEYDDILAIVLAKSSLFLNDKKAVDDFLFNNGYIGRRNFGKIEGKILANAKKLREGGAV